MNRVIFYGLLVMIILLGMSSCVYNDEESLYPQTNPPNSCNITDVSFADDVVPILQSECLACHSEQNAPLIGASIILEGHANVKTYVDNGRFGGAVNHDVPFSPMPKGAPKLGECELETLNKWIEDGSPDN